MPIGPRREWTIGQAVQRSVSRGRRERLLCHNTLPNGFQVRERNVGLEEVTTAYATDASG